MKSNKKNWLKAPLLIVSFCLVIFACRKELQPPGKNEVLENPTVKMDVELAKAFYRNFKKENGDKVNMTQYANLSQSNKKTSALRTETNGITNRKYLFFKKAYTSETPNSSFVEVPVLYNQRFSTILPNVKLSTLEKKEIFAASFDRMIIFKNKKTGKLNQRMITFVPNIEYLRKHKNDISHNHITRLDKDFDGYLEYKDWNGSPLYMIKYVKGKKTKIIRLKNKAKIRNTDLNMATARTTCTAHLVEIWGESCVVVDPEGLYQQCEPYLVDSYFVEECVEEDPLTGDPCIDYGDCLTGDPCIDYGDCLTGDPCIDFGICDDDNTPTTPVEPVEVINLNVIDTTGLSQYPAFKALITNLSSFLKNPSNSNILAALSHYTGFSNAKILELMKPNVGPRIAVVDFPPQPNGSTLFGEYNNMTKTISINAPLIRGLDAVSDGPRYNAMVMLMTITTLHEFVHYGRDYNGLPVRIAYQGGAYEAGYTFEMNIQPPGIDGQGINRNTAIQWIKFYEYNVPR